MGGCQRTESRSFWYENVRCVDSGEDNVDIVRIIEETS